MKKVLVIGGGIAGMSASIRLIDAGFQVTLLERSASPGGRIKKLTPRGHAKDIDRGQHLMLGCYHEALALVKRLGTQNQLQRVMGTTPFLSGPGQIHPYRLGRLPSPLHALPGLLGLTQLGLMDRLALGRVVLDAKLQILLDPGKLDGLSAQRWLTRNGQSPKAMHGFWEPLTVATLNLPTKQASALLLATVLDKGLFARQRDAVPLLPKTTLHDLFIAPLHKAIETGGGRVVCRETAREIAVGESSGLVESVTTQSGRIFDADFFLLAIPPWDVPLLLKKNSELEWVSNCAERLSFSPIVGIELWYDRNWMRYPYAGLLNSPLQWIFNHNQDSQLGQNGGSYRVSLVISHAKKQIKSQAEELVAECASEVGRFFPEAQQAKLLGSLVIRAPKATFRAAPGQALLRPPTETNLKNLFLAGDWTDTGLPSTIESAVISGRMADEAIKRRLPIG
ncbi:MAG: FAD-dependent oxidoreductase [Deltaproteobacteria bacterium]|nr:FAD-dependent oxidoreductase [Deltaproteobacteria bacterium]